MAPREHVVHVDDVAVSSRVRLRTKDYWCASAPYNFKLLLAGSIVYGTARREVSARWLQHSSTLQLAGGKILITGGRDGGAGSTMLNSADVYNPATGLFSATGNLLEPRQYHSATLLLNGKVLVAGGMSPTGTAAISTAELYQ